MSNGVWIMKLVWIDGSNWKLQPRAKLLTRVSPIFKLLRHNTISPKKEKITNLPPPINVVLVKFSCYPKQYWIRGGGQNRHLFGDGIHFFCQDDWKKMVFLWCVSTRSVRGCSWQLFHHYDYLFKLFHPFWLAFSLISRLILHNQLALTKFGRCLPTSIEVTCYILLIDRKRDRRRRGRSAALAVQSRRKQRRVWQGYCRSRSEGLY